MPRLTVQNMAASLKFDGTATKVVVPIILSPTNFNLAFWARDLGTATNGRVFSCRAISPSSNGFEFMRSSNTNSYVAQLSDAGATTASVIAPVNSGISQWSHVAITFTNNDLKVYVNGVVVAADTSCTMGEATGQALTIGDSSFTAGTKFAGLIRSIVVANTTPWTQDQVNNLYRTGTVPGGATAILDMNEGTGATANDTSGNGNHGAITSGTWSTSTPTKSRITHPGRMIADNLRSSLWYVSSTQVSLPTVPDVNSFSFAARVWWPVGSQLVGGRRIYDWQDASGGFTLRHSNPNSQKVAIDTYNGASATTVISSNSLSPGWHTIGFTRNSTLTTLYVDGVSVGQATATLTAASATTAIIGRATSGVQTWVGGICAVVVHNGNVWSDEQMLQYHHIGAIPSTPTGVYRLDDGAGTTANDLSGNGNHGTISGDGYFSLNVPTKKRTLINDNLISNGDFEYAPPFTAAQNTSNAYIDGTASGSSINKVFGAWAIPAAALTASATAAFDTVEKHSGTYSLKISTTDATGNITVSMGRNGSTPDRDDVVPLLPNTSYTLTAWIKGINVPTNGVFADLREYNGSVSAITTTATNKLSGTFDWTQVTAVVTTQPNCRYGQILLRRNVTGNVSDVWFDDIVLKPTTPTARAAA